MTRVPAVMIHGAFCGGWAFEPWRALFAAHGFDAHAPNLRHHAPGVGATDALGSTSMRDYAADLENLLDHIGGWPILIGHSLGGLLCQMLAARKRVRALVLLAPSPPWGMLPSTPFEFVSAHALYLDGAFWRKAVTPRRWVANANALDLLLPEERDAVFARFVPESGRAMFETMHWMLDGSRATHVDPRAVVCPILCVAGARDRVNSPSTVRQIARRYGGRARFEIAPDHSHWLLGEPGWEKIAAGTLDWLKRILDRDPERVGGAQ